MLTLEPLEPRLVPQISAVLSPAGVLTVSGDGQAHRIDLLDYQGTLYVHSDSQGDPRHNGSYNAVPWSGLDSAVKEILVRTNGAGDSIYVDAGTIPVSVVSRSRGDYVYVRYETGEVMVAAPPYGRDRVWPVWYNPQDYVTVSDGKRGGVFTLV